MTLKTHWAPYEPDARAPWNLNRVVHLHRRARFAAGWDELQRDLKGGPAASVDRVLAGKSAPHAPADFSSTADLLADAAVGAGEIARLKAWWFYRMVFGPDALGEKLTLLWHDHFATANSKVQAAGLMRRQNDALRKHARGRFSALVNATVREPALLLYLDAPANRKGRPNENLARELMELFTLGVGHYSEKDVKEAARALTGWTVEDNEFAEAPAAHDAGEKTILGKTGKWTGGDLVKLLVGQPATAKRVAWRLCRQFFGEKGVSAAAMTALTDGLRERDLDVGWAAGLILRSRLFFAEENIGARVLSPVEFVVGPIHALSLFDPTPSTLALADWSARMGQDVLDPPNVGGWPGGRAWIHSRSLIARANYASALVSGPNVGRSSSYDPLALPKKYGFGTTADAVLSFHHQLLFGAPPPAGVRRRAAGLGAKKVVTLLLSAPEAQLG
jgi:uncharacterized protein (DUF1800 family)